MKDMGIYCIKNKVNGKCYVGQTADIYLRIRQHRSELRSKKHVNKLLQTDWDSYGEENFEFSTLEICSAETLNDREHFWANELNSQVPNGYNIVKAGHAPLVGTRFDEEARAKMSKWHKEHNAGEGNGFYGKKHTEETLKRISESLKGKCVGEKNGMFGKYGELNPFYGKTHTEETRAKMRENHADMRGAKHPRAKFSEEDVKKIINLMLNGVPTKEVAKMYSVSLSCISGIRTHKKWKHLTEDIVFPHAKKR